MHIVKQTLKPLMPALGVLLGIMVSYWGIIQIMVAQWQGNEDYSHGLLILPISLYLIWLKRDELRTADVRPEWQAVFLMLAAFFIYIIGELGAELFTTRVSMLVLLIGGVWMLYGSQVMSILRFPMLFLFVMLPLPGFIYRNITFSLQLLSSKWSVALLHLLGYTVYREGNVIDMGFAQFQVVEACNGLRFILPLFALGLLFAYFGRKAMWRRVILVAATIPFAMVANIVRIAGTGMISKYWGVEAAEGFFHSFSGWAVFMLCFGLFGLLNWLLTLLPGEPAGSAPGEGAAPGADAASASSPEERNAQRLEGRPSAGSGWRIPWGHLAVVIGLILALPTGVKLLGSVPPRPLIKPLTDFPLVHNGYSGTPSEMEELIWERVGGQEYVIIDYHQVGAPSVNFYAVYYEYQRKAGDFIHSPKLCLPGAGWFIGHDRVRTIPLDDTKTSWGDSLRFNEILIEKGGVRQLVYYWYQGRNRNFTNEYAAKFYMVWDGLVHRRTDGALVRLVMPLGNDMPLDSGRRLMDDFAQFVSTELAEHLP